MRYNKPRLIIGAIVAFFIILWFSDSWTMFTLAWHIFVADIAVGAVLGAAAVFLAIQKN